MQNVLKHKNLYYFKILRVLDHSESIDIFVCLPILVLSDPVNFMIQEHKLLNRFLFIILYKIHNWNNRYLVTKYMYLII